MSLTIAKTPRIHCPRCGNLLSAISDCDGHTPQPGDFSVCAYCLAVLVITEGLGLRLPTPEETIESTLNPGVQEMRTALLHHRGPIEELKRHDA